MIGVYTAIIEECVSLQRNRSGKYIREQNPELVGVKVTSYISFIHAFAVNCHHSTFVPFQLLLS